LYAGYPTNKCIPCETIKFGKEKCSLLSVREKVVALVTFIQAHREWTIGVGSHRMSVIGRKNYLFIYLLFSLLSEILNPFRLEE
jgi:hypothetical protein